jgi:hypothetical protein
VHPVLRLGPQSFWVLAGWAAATIFLIGTGILLAFNPALFVRLFHRIAIGDYYVKSQEFEKGMVSVEGRIDGFLFLSCGLLFLYLWLRAIHGIN